MLYSFSTSDNGKSNKGFFTSIFLGISPFISITFGYKSHLLSSFGFWFLVSKIDFNLLKSFLKTNSCMVADFNCTTRIIIDFLFRRSIGHHE